MGKVFDWFNSVFVYLAEFFDITSLWDLAVAVIQIIIIAAVIYKIIGLVSDTRAWQLLKGVIILLLVAWGSELIGFTIISSILNGAFTILAFALLVVFQDELKKILERLGSSNLKNIFNSPAEPGRQTVVKAIEDISAAAYNLSLSNTGALIVIEREIRLGEIIATGTGINSEVSTELLEQIFVPNTPLHDGAVVVRQSRIMAASCLLPLTSNVNLSKELGTRHRAAIGITEISDCIAVVVSEETGKISVTMDGKIRRGFDKASLNHFLNNTLFVEEEKKKKRLFGFKRSNKGERKI